MIFSVIIYGTNINTTINKSFKDVFVYCILLKSFLKFCFSFDTFFLNFDLRLQKIAEIILAPSPITSKSCYKRQNEFAHRSSTISCWLLETLITHILHNSLWPRTSQWELVILKTVNVATIFLVTFWVNGGGGIVE